MTIVLLQLFSRDTTRWIKVTDCGTSHWPSHAMSLSLSPHFFSLSLSIYFFSFFACCICLAPWRRWPSRCSDWDDDSMGWRVMSREGFEPGFYWLSETFWNKSTLPHCRRTPAIFGTPLELIFSPNRNKFTGGFSPTSGPRSHPDRQPKISLQTRASFGTVSAFSALWKRRKSGADNRFAFKIFQKEMQRTSLGPETDETADSWALTVAQKSDWTLRSS